MIKIKRPDNRIFKLQITEDSASWFAETMLKMTPETAQVWIWLISQRTGFRPSVETMQERFFWPESTINDCMNELVALGYASAIKDETGKSWMVFDQQNATKYDYNEFPIENAANLTDEALTFQMWLFYHGRNIMFMDGLCEDLGITVDECISILNELLEKGFATKQSHHWLVESRNKLWGMPFDIYDTRELSETELEAIFG